MKKEVRLRFFHPNDLDCNLKATIHKTGKLGFTKNAIARLGLDNRKSISIGESEEFKNGELFIIVNENNLDVNSFKVNKAGPYYYISTKSLFDRLNVNYKSHNISYDISIMDDKFEGQTVYKLTKRNNIKSSL